MGSLVLVFGIRLVVQGIRENNARRLTVEDYLAARESLSLAFAEADVMRRILSTEDIRFISEAASPEAQKLFHKERKKLAIRWIRRTQQQISELMKLHLMLASYATESNNNLDIGLSIRYAAFNAISTVVLVVIWLAGPLKAAVVVDRIIGSANYFLNVFHLRQFNVQVSRLMSGRGYEQRAS
jgi:nucleotide-binding universal stress UspA family protein